MMVYTSNARMSPVKPSNHTNNSYVTLKENQNTIPIKTRKTHKTKTLIKQKHL